MPLLTCSSLFSSIACCSICYFLDVCVDFLFSVRTVLSTEDGPCECILTWVCWSLDFLCFHWLQQHRCALLAISASNFFSLCIAFLSCSVPVLQLWPLPCDLYDISDSAHLFLLYFDCAIYLSALCLMCSCALSPLTPRMGARLLNVYSNVFHQWCRARSTECNHMLYVFIKLWLPLSLLPIFSISLCLCCSTLLYEKLLSIPFSPRLPHLFYF